MYRLASRVTVFRDARYVGTWNLDEARREDLIMAMVGRASPQFFPSAGWPSGRRFSAWRAFPGPGYFKDVSFSLRKGEILAITGLIGAGQHPRSVRRSMASLILTGDASSWRAGAPHRESGPGNRAGNRVPAGDRLRQGLVLEWELAKNVTLPTLGSSPPWAGSIRRRRCSHEGAGGKARGESGQRLRPGLHAAPGEAAEDPLSPSSLPAP